MDVVERVGSRHEYGHSSFRSSFSLHRGGVSDVCVAKLTAPDVPVLVSPVGFLDTNDVSFV
eukprot:4404018-Prorocentrum_lima.AAC.1